MSIHEFTLPDVGEGLDKGVILTWRVAPGEVVTADQIIVEVETDKAIVEIPSPVNGVLATHGAQAGETLAVGAVLATFEVEGSASAPAASPKAPERPAAAARTSEPSPPAAPVSAPAAPPTLETPAREPSPAPRRVRASPATRKLARSLGIDLTQVSPSGSRGQVTRADIEAAASGASSRPLAVDASARADTPAPMPAPMPPLMSPPMSAPIPASDADATTPGTTVALSGLRRQIALNMQEAWRTVPHIFTLEEIDASELVRARAAVNQDLAASSESETPARISYLPFLVKATVAALRAHPRFNASLDMAAETVTYHAHCHIGIATATPQGLIVTVVRDADTKSLVAIAREIEELAALARARRVSVDQIRGATFTVSNYGSYGAWMGTPIIRPPEVAIAGFGRIHEAVVPVDGVAAVRTMLPMCVSADHRLNDGEHLGAFMATLTRYLSAPVRLLAT